MSLDVDGHKAVALSVMFIVTLLFSLLPLYVREKLAGRLHLACTQKALSGILCFGAGVLLATVFLHLMPEARIFVEDAKDGGFLPDTQYPLAELMVCGGFFIIYTVEEIVHSSLIRNAKVSDKNKPKDIKPDQLEMCGDDLVRVNKQSSGDALLAPKDSRPENIAECGAGHSHGHGIQAGMSLLRAVVVVIAFSFHSVMEGLALGLQHEGKGVWFLFGALMAHKVIVAFCMAMELLEVGVSRVPFLISMSIFSLSSPLGGLLGALVMTYSTTETAAGVLVPTVLQGISAGTILYVTFCEVLERERAKPEGSTVRLLCLLVGFSFMAGLQVLDQKADLITMEAAAFTNATLI